MRRSNGGRISTGVLGTGASLAVNGLSLGTHTITLRADDGEGGISSDQVRVSVVEDVDQLPPVPDALTAGPSRLTIDPGLGQTTAELSIANENPRRALAWSATANAPWVQLSSANGTTPATVTVGAGGPGLMPGVNSPTSRSPAPPAPVIVGVEATSSCAGDCNGDGQVSIDELVRAVGIALGSIAVVSAGRPTAAATAR